MSGMTHERMAAILAAYGASPARWPLAERAAAEAWAAANTQAFAALAETEAPLDALLDLDGRGIASEDALAARILAARDGGNVVRAQFGKTRGVWMQAAALAACTVLGLAIGFTQTPMRDDLSGEFDAAFSAAFDLPSAPGPDGVEG